MNMQKHFITEEHLIDLQCLHNMPMYSQAYKWRILYIDTDNFTGMFSPSVSGRLQMILAISGLRNLVV